MSIRTLDATGCKCPQPILKIAVEAADMSDVDILEVVADCPTFEKDVRLWCERTKKTLLWIRQAENGKRCCQIQF